MFELNRNINNEGLEPLGGSRFVIGYVDEVNGWGSRECPGYVPTRHELLVLAEYWAKEGIESSRRLQMQPGSTDLRLHPFANQRLGRIEEILRGDAEGTMAFDNVIKKVKTEVG